MGHWEQIVMNLIQNMKIVFEENALENIFCEMSGLNMLNQHPDFHETMNDTLIT